MDNNNNETKLEGIIRDAVGGESSFDFAKWKSEHADEVEAYRGMTGAATGKEKRKSVFKLTSIIGVAAAVLVVAFLIWPDIGNENDPVKGGGGLTVSSKYTPLPAHLPTIGRLNAAYAEGGIEAVDEFCERSVRKSGARPGNLTARDLLVEYNSIIETEKGSDNEDQSFNSNISSINRA